MTNRRLLNMLLPCLLLLAATPARADSFYVLFGYTCELAQDRVAVHFRGAYNEAGEAMMAAKKRNEWEPWSLMVMKDDGDHVKSLKTIRRVCKLKSGTYHVSMGPKPGNWNIQGRCGASISAWAEIRRGRTVVLPQHAMEDDCHSKNPITTRIEISGGREPVITTMEKEAFYK